jgi:hypothetical protein
MQFNTEKPVKSALYLVDRGMQGKWYRWYDAEVDKWGRCGSDMNDALNGKDKFETYDIVGFFPWAGPLTGPKFNPNEPVKVIEDDKVKQPKQKKVARKMARQRTADVKPKLVISQVGNTKVGSIVKGSKTVHPDGTVFYRADRQKWVAMWNGKQEAARPTAEACLAFLKKKYNHDGVVLK